MKNYIFVNKSSSYNLCRTRLLVFLLYYRYISDSIMITDVENKDLYFDVWLNFKRLFRNFSRHQKNVKILIFMYLKKTHNLSICTGWREYIDSRLGFSISL